MEIITIELGKELKLKDELALCIGYFDGLHKGHQKLIFSATCFARKNEIKSGLITFDPDPITVVSKDIKFKKHITKMEDRIEIGKKLGLDYWLILRFTKEMSQLSPEEFIDNILKPLNVRFIACGADFRFGSKGAGNPTLLVERGKGIYQVQIVDLIYDEGEKVSSTRIIQNLQEGNIEEVNRLLGWTYYLSGPVIGGNRKGTEIGFPTANLYVDEEYYLPKQGVYAGVALVKGELLLVMINIGHNLTFNTRDHLSVEGNILDFNDTIYGERIRYYFVKYLRDELKFKSVDELIEQMHQDELETREVFRDKDLKSLVELL